jgi:chromosome segregation ATPase
MHDFVGRSSNRKPNCNHQNREDRNNMKTKTRPITIAALLTLAMTPAAGLRAADSAERAGETKAKIEAMRVETAKIRNQILLTMEALKRLNVKGVELRPQFETFKAELVKMEEQAKIARERANSMKEKGKASFQEWEKEVQTINNADIRKQAEKRYDKRKKSYDKILTAMQEAREELVPFMSDLNDIRKLLDSELTEKSVSGTKMTIRSADWHGEDVRDSLSDVEKELDRVAADLAKYK